MKSGQTMHGETALFGSQQVSSHSVKPEWFFCLENIRLSLTA